MRTTRIARFRDDERGVSTIFVGVGFMAFMAATTLAVDVGMFMTAKSQAQNAADAGALGGAVALAFNDFSDRTSTGPAVETAIGAARANPVMGEAVSITPADVIFLTGPGGASNRVQVTVYRTEARANPVATVMGGLIGVTHTDIAARAIAEAAPANAATCVAPFTIPDRWIERQTPAWDPDDTFDAFPSNPSIQPDIYHPATQTDYTGYDTDRDTGLQLTLKAGTGNNIEPSFYFALALPVDEGASDYSWNINNCNTSILHFTDLLVSEPGNMVGPTSQGIQALIDLDPSAYWDTSSNRVVSTMNPSPRVKIVPLFDPYYWNVGKMNGRNADLKAATFIGFFFERLQGNEVIGRITPASGLLDDNAGPAPLASMVKAIRLVQ